MRYGKPTFIGGPKVASHEIADWVAQYNLSDIGSDSPQNQALCWRPEECESSTALCPERFHPSKLWVVNRT